MGEHEKEAHPVPHTGTHTVQPGGEYKSNTLLAVGQKTLLAVSCSFAVIAQNMQCQRVSLLLLALVYMVHAVPALQCKLLSEKSGLFVKVHSNGQVTAAALRGGKCVQAYNLLHSGNYYYLCVHVVLDFYTMHDLLLSLSFFTFLIEVLASE